jgi:CubicO group peptidase (beta-lactamase class C family)
MKYRIALLLLLMCHIARSQELSTRQIDSLAMLTLKTFRVPGMAVGIIKDGKIIHSRGYGVRSLKSGLPVDENTLFGIASNTKAFTATAIAILVDQGKLRWNDRVKKYLPEFQMYDPYVTAHMTITDLLAHHSGLGQGEGDLQLFPSPNQFTTADVIHSLRYLKPVYDFRTTYGYSNVLYAVAGEIVARVSGGSYADFVERNIMRPLMMTRSRADYERIPDKTNVIDPHKKLDDRVVIVPRNTLPAALPAGGVYASLADMEKWIIMQLNDGRPILSAATHQMLWTPQTIMPVNGPGPYQTRMAAYGMGFEIYDVTGDNRQIRHTGGIDGMVSMVTMIPELHLGIIVMTNQEEPGAFITMTNAIKDGYLGIKGHDRLAENRVKLTAVTTTVPKLKPVGTPGIYTGGYRDKWLGNATVTLQGSQIRFNVSRSPKLSGTLSYDNEHRLVVYWDDRTLNADAFVDFSVDQHGRATGFTMRALSDDTDFSFDFQDLHFIRLK